MYVEGYPTVEGARLVFSFFMELFTFVSRMRNQTLVVQVTFLSL